METLESVTAAREEGRWPRILPADWPLAHLPKAVLNGAQVTRVLHGQAVPGVPVQGAAARIRLYDEAGRFLGIGESDSRGSVQPRRLFNGP
jgi:tRNA pseudouridine55 synthase